MENNGVCGGVTSLGATFNDPAAAGGPYTGAPVLRSKFYFQDNHDTGPAVSMGAVLQLPGQPEVIVTAIDPKYGSPGDPGTSSAGTLRFNNTTGVRTNAYRIYRSVPAPARPPVFGKANGLGDLKAFCDVALPAVVAPAAPAVAIAVAVPDLVITKSADQRIVRPGDDVTYTITVFNKGGAPAPNLIITDPVPSPLQVRSAAASQGTFGIAGNTVTFLVGTVNPGQTVTLTIRANVPSNAQAPQDVYNIIISAGIPKATEAIRITRGTLPSTGEHPDATPAPVFGWLLVIAAAGGGVVTVLLLRSRSRQAQKG